MKFIALALVKHGTLTPFITDTSIPEESVGVAGKDFDLIKWVNKILDIISDPSHSFANGALSKYYHLHGEGLDATLQAVVVPFQSATIKGIVHYRDNMSKVIYAIKTKCRSEEQSSERLFGVPLRALFEDPTSWQVYESNLFTAKLAEFDKRKHILPWETNQQFITRTKISEKTVDYYVHVLAAIRKYGSVVECYNQVAKFFVQQRGVWYFSPVKELNETENKFLTHYFNADEHCDDRPLANQRRIETTRNYLNQMVNANRILVELISIS